MKNKKNTSPWAWVPSLYLAEGLPNVAITTVSVALYTKMGLSIIHIALYTSILNVPWIIKPLWSPFVDILKTKRWWILIMQLLIGAGFAGVAFSIPTSFYLQATIAFFYLLAFSSATHDIAVDGFYMLGLDTNQQAAFVGIRNTFYKVAVLIGQGALLYLAGHLERITGNVKFAWSTVFFTLAGLFILFNLYHRFVLPKPVVDIPKSDLKFKDVLKEFLETFVSFFTKPQILTALFFLLTFRLGESQLQKLIIPFLDAPVGKGGLGLTMEDIGIIYGTVGIIALVLGGIVGGVSVSRGGLKKWIWPMTLSMILTGLSFVYLSFAQPQSLPVINICVAIEQFGYGFGFTAYTLYMIYFSVGEYKTSHYAICTGFMALGLALPGTFAGWMQQLLGYEKFFIWVMICSIIPIIAVSLLKINPEFGNSTLTD